MDDGARNFSDHLHVVAAVIRRSNGEVLIARRPTSAQHGGLWEFPGGKVEAGESAYEALARELAEELGIEVRAAHPLIRVPHDYPQGPVLLDVWEVKAFDGVAHGREGQPLAWVASSELGAYRFPEANLPIISAVQLPTSYLVTPDPGTRRQWPQFLEQLGRLLAAGVSLVQLRAKCLEPEEYQGLARQTLALCREHGARLLLNAPPEILQQIDADGVHLSTARLMALNRRPDFAGKLTAASCHSPVEVDRANRLGLDFIVVSPVKPTASHPEAAALGWDGLWALTECARVPAYALGGMRLEDIEHARELGAQGIAAISALWGDAGY